LNLCKASFIIYNARKEKADQNKVVPPIQFQNAQVGLIEIGRLSFQDL